MLQSGLVSTSSNPSKFVLAPFSLTGLVYQVQFLGMITSDNVRLVSHELCHGVRDRSALVPVVLGD